MLLFDLVTWQGTCPEGKGDLNMVTSRIPEIFGVSKKAASAWLTEMQKQGLFFCIDDDPREIVSISDGSRVFTDEEAAAVSKILDRLFVTCGDGLYDLAFEVFSKVFHTKAERRAAKIMYG